MIRVLVVDDHPIVRRGLCAEINLAAGMEIAGEAIDGLEAVEQAHRLKPDVILMDLVMPRMDGVAATTEIIRQNPLARILVLTSFTDDERVYNAVMAGAMGYILKDCHPDEVLAAIRTVAQGEPCLDSSTMRGLLREIRQSKELSPNEILTPREMDILHRVAQGTANKEIGRLAGISEATVRVHVSNILSKLGLENRSQLVLYAVQHGLVAKE